jgi:short-subunit dehydrogenase
VYIASRSEAKFRDTKQDIIAEHPEADIRLLKLDLADLDNVREAAE